MTRRNRRERRESAAIPSAAAAVLRTIEPDKEDIDGPLTSLVTALAAGAVAALQSTVEQVVKDGYAALKGLIQRKYAWVQSCSET
jgi:hypothetical protein